MELIVNDDEMVIAQEKYRELIIKESNLENIKKVYLKGDYIYLFQFVGFVLGLPSYEELKTLRKSIGEMKEDE